MKTLLAVVGYFSIVRGYSQEIIKTSACDGYNETCSPSWCAAVANPACVDPLDGNEVDPSKGFQLSYGGLVSAYCNDAYLVISSTGEPNHPNTLKNIPRPPGENGVPYPDACVTRSFHEQMAIYKLPLYPTKLATSTADNNIDVFNGQTDPKNIDGYGLPESGPVSVTVSGQAVFPLFNNVGKISFEECEMDGCSAHAGEGFDYHYHGDPYSPVNGTCMYSPSDYSSDETAHPPLIAWGLDGFAIYGRHLSSTNLGSIADVSFFGNSVPFQSRPDLELLQPCCYSTEYVALKGYKLKLEPDN